jgi:methionine-rich copper-binding protein CopC
VEKIMKKNMILIFLVALWLIPTICFAHVGMLNSSPAKNGFVSSSPEKVTIKFGGELEPAFSKVEVFDQNDKKVSGKTTFLKSNKVMESELDENLSPGTYTVKIKCISLDGHTIKEEYTFFIE